MENPIKIQQLLQALKNTFAMSGITLATSWLPMLFAVFMNELRCVPFRKFVQTVTTLPNFISWVLVYSVAYSLFNSTGMANTCCRHWGLPRSQSFPPVLGACMADDVAVAHLEEPGWSPSCT